MTAASDRASEDAAIDAAACAHIGPNGPDDAIREAGRHAFKAGAYWMRGILRAELEKSRRERDSLRMNSVSLRDRDKDVQRIEAAFKGRIAEIERERDEMQRARDKALFFAKQSNGGGDG